MRRVGFFLFSQVLGFFFIVLFFCALRGCFLEFGLHRMSYANLMKVAGEGCCCAKLEGGGGKCYARTLFSEYELLLHDGKQKKNYK